MTIHAKEMKIERAQTNDIEQLSELLLILMAQEEDFSPNITVHKKGIAMIVDAPEHGCILTLKEDDKLIGMIGILYSISTALGAKVATFEDFIIMPDYRGKGYGRLLFEKALAEAKATQCQRITLLTDGSNNKAQAFYIKQGMSPSAMVPYRLSL